VTNWFEGFTPNTVDFLTGGEGQPIGPSVIDNYHAAHGMAMFVACVTYLLFFFEQTVFFRFGVLMVIGVFVSRYMKGYKWVRCSKLKNRTKDWVLVVPASYYFASEW
jgi:hypothetical protein